jgi:transposase
MFGDFKDVRIYLKTGKTDFRKSVNGLSVMVQEEMRRDAMGGDLYIFCNRGRNRLKILYYEWNGFCLWYKRLEEDKFRWPKSAEEVMEITREELSWLLRGLDFRSAHRERRYESVS